MGKLSTRPEDINKKVKAERIKRKIILTKRETFFYENDTLKRNTSYKLPQAINWVLDFMNNCIRYADSIKEWLYDSRKLDVFTSGYLRIVQRSTIGHDEYMECYANE